MTTTANNDLALLNDFRVAEGKTPFADWRKARHQPMLEAYMAAAHAEQGMDEEGDEPDALMIDPVTGETVRESEIEEVAPVAEKLPAYKVLARQSGATSAIEKPVEFVHSFLNANPDMKRKAAVAALVEAGVNYSTARTQYQKWFSKK